MKSTPNTHHWQNRHRFVSERRMAWYGEAGDEQYWYEYWKARLPAAGRSVGTGGRAQGVAPTMDEGGGRMDIANDELGQVLLQSMRPDGIHLEAGCGAGQWVAVLRHYGFNVEGIENAHALVELVHSVYPQLPLRYGDALAIDRPDNHYDSYLSFGVVEHRLEGPEAFLTEAYRVLKPGGTIIISVPFFGPTRLLKARLSLYDRERPHLPFFQYGFTRSEFVELLQHAGFAVESAQGIYVHRMLLEEVGLYRMLVSQSWGDHIKQGLSRLLGGNDGHMLVVVGRKPTTR